MKYACAEFLKSKIMRNRNFQFNAFRNDSVTNIIFQITKIVNKGSSRVKKSQIN